MKRYQNNLPFLESRRLISFFALAIFGYSQLPFTAVIKLMYKSNCKGSDKMKYLLEFLNCDSIQFSISKQVIAF